MRTPSPRSKPIVVKDHSHDFAAMREHMGGMVAAIAPINDKVERLAMSTPHTEKAMNDIAQSMLALHQRMSNMEMAHQNLVEEHASRTAALSKSLISRGQENQSLAAHQEQIANALLAALQNLTEENRRLAGQSQNMVADVAAKLGTKQEPVKDTEDTAVVDALNKLIKVLTTRKMKIIRDSNGDMSNVEVTSSIN